MTGCATSYMMDRRDDAADIFTCTVGKGVGGVKTRLGPLGIGLLDNREIMGLRSGEFITPCDNPKAQDQFYLLLLSGEESKIGIERNKSYRAFYVLGVPLPVTPLPFAAANRYPACYFTQFDLTVGLGRSLTLGINPGEFIDFLLGWVGLDMYGDDLSRIRDCKSDSKSNHPAHATAKPAPGR